MICRRDLMVALTAIACTVGGFAIADELPLIGSSVFDWNSVQAKPRKRVRCGLSSRCAHQRWSNLRCTSPR